MKILVHSKISQGSINASLGKPEYSYYFLLKEFLPALKRAGDVIVVSDVEEAEKRYQQLSRKGHDIVLISVSPPHQTPLMLHCPTVTLFAWEFDTLPDTCWDENPGNDWRHVFAHTAGAICTSRDAADLVRQAAGPDFPVIALPAPVWDRYSTLAPRDGHPPKMAERYFSFTGAIIDSPILGLAVDRLISPAASTADSIGLEQTTPETPATPATPQHPADKPVLSARDSVHQRLSRWRRRLRLLAFGKREPVLPAATSEGAPPGVILVNPPFRLQVAGIVFTTLLNPGDSRKNWIDIITAFCWTFREQPNATLLVKMTHHDLEYYRVVLVTLLSRLSPFSCRVVALHGFMQDSQYAELISATTFYVNASSGEGLCLPLMEFLSAGVPAIAPTHTAMADYVDDSLALTVKCSLEPFCWPHDPTGMFTTHRHRLNWQSLMEAFQASYALATDRPERYQQMSLNAYRRMREYASVKAVGGQLSEFLATALSPARLSKRG